MRTPLPRAFGISLALVFAGACGDDMVGDDSDASTSSSATSTSSSSSSSSSESTTDATSTDMSTSTGEVGPQEAEVLRAQLTIPAGTKVVEFDADAAGLTPGFSTVGASVTVSVVDISHPDRDQTALCPTSHPLDGCATVDYGAFGVIHDNRLTVAGEGGPLSLHLFKDRSIQPEAETLAPDE